MTLDLEAPPSSAPTAAAASLPVRLRRLRRTPPSARWSARPASIPRCSSRRCSCNRARAVRDPIGSMPGQARLSPDLAAEEAARLAELGVGGVILFGLPESKDALGSEASAEDGIVQEAFRRIRALELPLVDDRGHVPVRVHGPRPLRAARGRRQRRQRRRARPARRDGRDPGASRRGHRRAERDDGRPGRRDPCGARLRKASSRPRSWPTPRSTPRPSTARSVRRPTARRPSAIDGVTRWTRPTVARRCGRWPSTSPRAPTSCLSNRRCPDSTSSPRLAPGSTCRSPPTRCPGEFAMIAAAAERGWLDGRRAMTEAVTGDRPGRRRDRHHLCRRGPRDLDPGGAMSADEQVYIQALALGLDPAVAATERRGAP